MSDWVTNEMLWLRSDELADSMLTMLEHDGGAPTVPGLPGEKNGPQVLRESLRYDADYFMSMDPQRLEDEYNAIARAAQYVAHDADPESLVATAAARLAANWFGDAADEFAAQLNGIGQFTTSWWPCRVLR